MNNRRLFTLSTRIMVAVGIILVAMGSPGPASAADTDFSYSGDAGPGFWGDLDPDWTACATDTRQSPINLTGAVPDETLVPLELAIQPTPLHIFNNGHTIEQEYEAGSTLTFKGTTYQLLQFHFHTLSEHTHDGQHDPMELHAVFQDEATGNYAVIGVFYHISETDTPNAFLAQFVDLLPEQNGETVIGADLTLNLQDGLTNPAAYYTYDGSLTTPPCSPTVTWIVLQEEAEMSQAQFDAFRRLLGNNFRPLQALNERVISVTPGGS